MLQLYVKRAKIFMHHVDGAEVRCALGRQEGPQDAPDWVRDAPGFKEGIKDKSIIDLTPPRAIPVKPRSKAKEEEEEEELSTADVIGESTDDQEDADSSDESAPEPEDADKDKKSTAKKTDKKRAPKGSVSASANVK